MLAALVHLCPRVPPLARSVLALLAAMAALAIPLAGAPGAAAAVAPAPSSSSSSPSTTAVPVNSPGPVLWTAPVGVDVLPIDGIACPSTALCVAVDREGDVLWSTDPAGGAATWQSADVDGVNELTSISCPSTGLCVAVDGAGNVITSLDPTGGAPAWAVAAVDDSATENNTDNAGSVLVRGVSCPSTGLCVAVDAAGNALVSTNPTGGATAWTVEHIDANTTHGCTGAGLTCQPPLVGISCPSTALCAAVDFSGNLLTTATPAAPAPWTSVSTDGGRLSSLFGISCPVISFCAAVDGSAGHAIMLNPAAPASQTMRSLRYSLDGIWCESPSLCLASVETGGGISALLGSYDPAAPASTWSLSSLGGVNAAACPSASLCLAADDEGNVAAGVTTTAITAALTDQLLHQRHPPTIPALNRTHSDSFTFTSPIAAQVTLSWTVVGPSGTPVTLAVTRHRFTAPAPSTATTTLTLRLSGSGRRLFRAATKRLTLTATATFAADTGTVSAVRTLTFARAPARKRTGKSKGKGRK